MPQSFVCWQLCHISFSAFAVCLSSPVLKVRVACDGLFEVVFACNCMTIEKVHAIVYACVWNTCNDLHRGRGVLAWQVRRCVQRLRNLPRLTQNIQEQQNECRKGVNYIKLVKFVTFNALSMGMVIFQNNYNALAIKTSYPPQGQPAILTQQLADNFFKK